MLEALDLAVEKQKKHIRHMALEEKDVLERRRALISRLDLFDSSSAADRFIFVAEILCRIQCMAETHFLKQTMIITTCYFCESCFSYYFFHSFIHLL